MASADGRDLWVQDVDTHHPWYTLAREEEEREKDLIFGLDADEIEVDGEVYPYGEHPLLTLVEPEEPSPASVFGNFLG